MLNKGRSKSPLGHFQGLCDFIQPSLAEDILKSSEYWTGSNEACRICFKSMFETIKNQGMFLRDLERVVNGKVQVSEFNLALAGKADFLEICGKISELKECIDKKASVNDVELCINLARNPGNEGLKGGVERIEMELKKKIENKEFFEAVNSINSKIQLVLGNFESKNRDFQGIEYKLQKLEDDLKRINTKFGKNEEDVQTLNRKIEKTERTERNVEELLQKCVTFEENFKELNRKIGKIIAGSKENLTEENLRFSFGHQIETEKEKVKIFEILNKKVDSDKMQEQFSNLMNYLQGVLTELHKKFEMFQVNIQQKFSQKPAKNFFDTDLEGYKEEMGQKLEKIYEKLEILWKTKPDKSEIRVALHEINQKLHTKLAQLTKPLKTEIDSGQFLEQNIKTIKPLADTQNFNMAIKKIEEIQKELLLKASVKDLCILLDMKANVEDINTALLGIHKELDCKNSIFPQGIWSFYNEKSGKVVYKGLKKSEFLCCEVENCRFVIGKSGFYEVKIVIFSEGCSKLQVLKNGELFLVVGGQKSEGFGMKVHENVELLQNDVIEIVAPASLIDLRGYMVLMEILM